MAAPTTVVAGSRLTATVTVSGNGDTATFKAPTREQIDAGGWMWTAFGTWNAASLQLSGSVDNKTTWVPVGTAMTADGFKSVLGAKFDDYKITVSSAGTSTALTIVVPLTSPDLSRPNV